VSTKSGKNALKQPSSFQAFNDVDPMLLKSSQPSHFSHKPLVVHIKVEGHQAKVLINTATIGTNLISSTFCYQNKIPSQVHKAIPISIAIKGS